MEQRLEILLTAGVITQRAYQGSLKVIAIIDEALSIARDNEQYQMAITHFARAADRVWSGQAVDEGLDKDIIDEIVVDYQYPQTLALHHKTLAGMGLIEVPQTEESFMLANIFSLIQASGEEHYA
ncbi:hypothetical protein [Vibrio gallicus]|uniref:hypothetical protein n=1 Tax=Vibrio gallicus TaxID=190897 RepID=UPI0021C4A03F|nr:hypothetical protein [Vibrio gallicus]